MGGREAVSAPLGTRGRGGGSEEKRSERPGGTPRSRLHRSRRPRRTYDHRPFRGKNLPGSSYGRRLAIGGGGPRQGGAGATVTSSGAAAASAGGGVIGDLG